MAWLLVLIIVAGGTAWLLRALEVKRGRAAGGEAWRYEYLPDAVPHQFRHLRNPDGTPNRAAFAVLRGDTLAPYVTAPREGEGTMHTDPPTPRPEPGTPPPPPDA